MRLTARSLLGVGAWIAVLLPHPLVSQAQDWIALNTPIAGRLQAPYFINPDTGFVYSPGYEIGYTPYPISSDTGIARTTDGGVTWTLIPSMASISVTQVCFESRTTGFLSTILSGGSGGIYKTTDAGETWSKLSGIPDGNYSSVYAIKGRVFASSFSPDFGKYGSIDYGSSFCSINDGATWSIIDSVQGLPVSTLSFQFITGNRDSLVAGICFGNPPQWPYQTYLIYSTNLGKVWRSADLGTTNLGMVSLFVIPHTCRMIRQFMDNTDSKGDTYSFLESDLSNIQNWRPSLLHHETGQWIAGNACAMYLSNAVESLSIIHAPYRSTDNGSSWQPLSFGPNCMEIDDDDYRNLSVVGYGTIVYAGGGVYSTPGALWKTIDGGDGALRRWMFAPQVVFGRVGGTHGALDSITTCETDSILLFCQNLTCALAELDSAWITGLDSNEYTQLLLTHQGCQRAPDSLCFRITPTKTGIRHLTIHVRFIDDEFETYNDSLQVTISVTVQPPKLVSQTQKYDLGLIGKCNGFRDTLLPFTNNGCGPDTITSIAIGGSAFMWIDDSLPTIVAPGRSATLRLRFLPPDSGFFSDTAVVTVTSGLSTSLKIGLTGTSIWSQLEFNSGSSAVRLDDMQICMESDSTLVLRNSGCDTIVITGDNTTWLSGWSGIDPSFPVVLPPDSSFSFRVHFAPSVVGNDTQYVQYLFNAGGLTGLASRTMMLSATTLSSHGILDVRSTSPQAGSFSFCTGDTMVFDTIKNIGCDTLSLSNGLLLGDASFTLLAPLPSLLAPDSVAIISIQFSPRTKGAHAAQLLFDSRSIHGGDTVRKTSIGVSGVGLRGSMMLAASTSALDLGTTPICQERDTFVVIQNVGCDTVCDSTVIVSTGAFQLAKPWSARCLAPGERDTVWLSSVMDTNGHHGQNLATLTIASNADTALSPITLAREIQYPAQWQLTLSASDSAYPGQPVTYKLIQHGTLPADDTAIDFVLHYDDDLLQFLNADESFARGAGFQPALHGMSLHIAPVPADSVLATLHFTTFLAPNQHTTLSIDGITFSSSLARPSDCIALAQMDTSGFTLRTICGATEILQELNNLPLTLDAIVPNPSHSEVTLYYSLAGSENLVASIQFEDALGRTALSRTVALESGTRQAITFDLSGIPSGMYSVRLGTAATSASRRIVKE